MKYKIPMCRPWITRKDREAVMRVLKSGRLSMGPEAEALEHEFARAHGYKYAVAVSSGGAAIAMLSRYHGCDYEITGATFCGVYNAIAISERKIRRLYDLHEKIDKGNSTITTALFTSSNIQPECANPVFADYCQAIGVTPGSKKNCVK